MVKYIASEKQAKLVGEKQTKGENGKDFKIFRYEHPQTNLTMFGIEIIATGENITLA